MMIEIQRVLETLESVLPEESEWQIMNSLEDVFSGATSGSGAPSSYCDFLKVANGGINGVVTLFSAEAVGGQQFYADETPGAAVQLGCDSWFCCGVISDEPFFISRIDGSIRVFPDAGVEWWMASRFEKVAEGASEFIIRYVAGPEYAFISPWIGRMSPAKERLSVML
jgi:hypothetical protein